MMREAVQRVWGLASEGGENGQPVQVDQLLLREMWARVAAADRERDRQLVLSAPVEHDLLSRCQQRVVGVIHPAGR